MISSVDQKQMHGLEVLFVMIDYYNNYQAHSQAFSQLL
jgi:hypothetical protein